MQSGYDPVEWGRLRFGPFDALRLFLAQFVAHAPELHRENTHTSLHTAGQRYCYCLQVDLCLQRSKLAFLSTAGEVNPFDLAGFDATSL